MDRAGFAQQFVTETFDAGKSCCQSPAFEAWHDTTEHVIFPVSLCRSFLQK